MSNWTEAPTITRTQGVDLSQKQYYIVKTNAARQVVLAAAAGDFIIGVVSTAPLTSSLTDSVAVAMRNGRGTFKVVAGGAIPFGSYLTSNSSGQAAVATPVAAGAAPASQVFGYAMEAATAAGQVIEFMWFDGLL